MGLPFMAALLAGAVVFKLGFSGAPLPYVGTLAVLAAAVATAYWWMRFGAELARGQVERWYGVRLVARYSSRGVLEQDSRGYWWTGYSYHRVYPVARAVQFAQWAVRDQQTRREALWLVVNPFGAAVLLGSMLVLLLGGVWAVGAAVVLLRDSYGGLGELLVSAVVAAVGVGTVLGVLLVLPAAVRKHGEWVCRVLGDGARQSRAELSERVAQLTETRADAVDAQAAELRRIERDLHDGAQARLVAIGLTLGTIEHLMASDQEAARELLAEAREASAKALQELRDLVRGIHPPVLAERGLPDAVRELALTAPVQTEVTVSLPGRPEASLETAVYFSVSELLANVAKHARAGNAWVDVLYRAGRLRVVVTDDGHGGARLEGGGGLRGIERRLGTFDGVISLDSPVGGPTTITMELPCVLSSPRISTSFAKV
ncbi:sensor histidine kinase [Kitasatospora sp. NPDC088391]|uniref:sensor histidine kinase n=1 Tax=Kitasatospora sp. NPDC088391 TaxID=3364074 RepID=UPI0038096148